MIRRVGEILLLILTSASALSGFAAECDLASIQAISAKNTTVTSAALIAGGTRNFCEISASVITNSSTGDTLRFELGLPDVALWNSRFLFTGNGGFAGSMNLDVPDLQAFGYAVAATDTGHEGDGTDASWALNNIPAVENFEYRGVHESALAAQAILRSYYSNLPYHSYFTGCSTGGREGLVEAQEFPADFDGIVAGDPAIGDPYIGFNWNSHALLQSRDAYLDPNAINLVDQTVTSECDGLDGVIDGLIQNPAECTFDPNTLLCEPGQRSACLTAAQVAALRAIYSGSVDTHGNVLYPGYSMSNPAESNMNDAAWGVWMTGCKSIIPEAACHFPAFDPSVAQPWSFQDPPLNSPAQWLFMDGFFQDFAFNDPNYNARTFSFVNQTAIDEVQQAVARWGGDGTNADITAFTNAGHKLLMYHGWSDPALTPFVSVNYYNSVRAILGSTISNSVRLFMVPGMHHCQGGPGPNVFDTLIPLTQWVEDGIAPDGIIARHYQNNDPTLPVQRMMPLCSYPELAKYQGGPVDDASSWFCPSTGSDGL